MLKQRLLTTLWGLPLITAAIWFGEPWFTIVVAPFGLLAIYEFYKIVASKQVSPLMVFGIIGTLLFILSPHFPYYTYGVTTQILLTSLLLLSLIWLLRHPQREEAFARWAWTMAGILYVGWLLSYLIALRGLEAGKYWVFLAMFITFASDTSAFFVGRTWGKHRLAPRNSPGKTWEGAIAGVLGAVISSLILVKLLAFSLSHGQAILLGLLVTVSGQLGDLVESLFKRNMGIKETGKLLPGHGGILDRLDSIFFTSAVVYYYALAYQAGWLNWL